MRSKQSLEDERRNIVNAAAALFMALGYDSVRMCDVSESLNIPNATLRRHFASKTKLLIAAVAHIAERIGKHWESELREGKGNAIVKVRRLLPLQSQPVQSALRDCGQNGNAKLITWLATALAERLSPALTGLIRQGCNEGLFKVQYPEEVAQFMLVGLQFLTRRGLRPWNAQVYLSRVASVPSIVEALLAAPRGSLAFLSLPVGGLQSEQHEN